MCYTKNSFFPQGIGNLFLLGSISVCDLTAESVLCSQPLTAWQMVRAKVDATCNKGLQDMQYFCFLQVENMFFFFKENKQTHN